MGEGSDFYTARDEVMRSEKPSFRFSLIPYGLRFGFAWTLFFAAIGVVIQSIAANDFILNDFFIGNYMEWFRSFGNFTNRIIYPSVEDFVLHLLNKWYYFFYTVGLLSLIWEFLSLIVNFEVLFKKQAKPLPSQPMPKSPTRQKIATWLKTGDILLSEQRIEEAKEIYTKISHAYNPLEDPNHEDYEQIINFYKKIPKK